MLQSGDNRKERGRYDSGRLRNVAANGSDSSWLLHTADLCTSNVALCRIPFPVRAVGDTAPEVRLVALLSPYRPRGRVCCARMSEHCC
jgi:hypothetical protein